MCWNDVTKFWALLKYEDIRYVSTNPDKFSSTKGITIPDPVMPNPVQEGNLIFTDPPRHRQLRKLINTGFTRRQVAILEPKVREIVYGVLDDVRPDSTLEFAEELAAPLPTRMIAELLGAPPDDWEKFRRWSDACTGNADPEIELDSFVAIGELFEYFQQLIAARRAEPRNDMLSVLSTAEVDGAKLTDEDLLNFAFLLLVAGNETTRNLIALGTLALIEHPGRMPQARQRPHADPRRGGGDAALDQPGDAHGAGRDGRRRDPRAAHPRGRHGRDALWLGQPRRGDLRFRRRGIQDRLATRTRTSRSAAASTRASGLSWPGSKPASSSRCCSGRYPELELVGDVDRMRATMVPGVKRMPVRLGTGS